MDQLSLDLVLDTSQATQSSNAYFNTFEQNVQKLNAQLDSLAKPRQVQFKVSGQETLDGAARKVKTIEENTKMVKERVATLNGEWGKTPEQIRSQVRYLQEVQAKTTKYRDETGIVSQNWIKVNQKVQEGLALLRQKTNGGFLDQANELTGIISGRVDTLNGKWGRSPEIIKGQVSYLQQVLDKTTKYDQKTGKLRDGWVKVNSRVNEGLTLLRQKTPGGFVEQTKAALGPLTAKFAAAQLAAGLAFAAFNAIVGALSALGSATVGRAADLQALKLALEDIVPPQVEIQKVLRAAVTDSLQYGASLEGMEKGYRRLTPVILANGGTMEDVRQTIISLAARTTELGLNNEQAGRYFEAFSQVMGKGRLQAEELNQQFSELDGALRVQIANYLKAEFGITDLNAAMQKGEVTAEMFRKAFIAISQDAVKKLQGSVGELNQRFFTLGEEGGATINQLNETIGTLWSISLKNTADAFAPLIEYIYAMGGAFLQAAAAFNDKFPGVVEVVQFLSEAIGATLYGALVLIIATFELVAFALEVAIQGYKALGSWIYNNIPGMNALIDSLGKAMQFIGSLFPKWIDNNNNLENTTETLSGALAENEDKVRELNKAYGEGRITASQYEAELEKINRKEEEAIRNGYVQALKERQAELKENIEREKELQAEIRTKITEEKQQMRELEGQIRERYQKEIADIRSAKNESIAKLDAELARLEAQTPVQKRLQEIRKEKIEQQLRSGDLTEEERLQLIDQLQEMDRQDERRRIKAEKQAVSKKAEEDEAKLIAQQEREMNKLNRQLAQNIKELTRMLEESGNRVRNMEQGYTAIEQEIGRASYAQEQYNIQLNFAEKTTPQLSSANQSLGNSYNSLSGNIDSTTQSYKRLAAAIREANRARAGAKSEGSSTPRAEGGPVAGGQTYTVNELGKEAFLSASGRLSMINAPAWGEWRAPSSGTVIPAHFASQLDVPSGGINLNSAAMNRGMGAVRTISNVRNGDNISNTVTIQTDKPRQAAADVMVQLAKLKSVKYR